MEKAASMPKQAWPTLTFDQSFKLFLNREEVQIVHSVHGHTDDDTVVLFPQNKAISMGALYFSSMCPIFHPEHTGERIMNFLGLFSSTNFQLRFGWYVSTTRTLIKMNELMIVFNFFYFHYLLKGKKACLKKLILTGTLCPREVYRFKNRTMLNSGPEEV